jgi:TonB family protein
MPRDQNARVLLPIHRERQAGFNPVDKESQTLRLTAEFNTMKAVNKLAVLISLGALLPFAVSAKSPEQAYLDASSKAPGVPVPVAVVSPSDIDAKYIGAQVELAFTVDATGNPTGFSVVSSPDATLAKVMMDAVTQWRFTPAQKNGMAIATKVVLPLRVSGTDNRFAAN